jgi:hypothetical protein
MSKKTGICTPRTISGPMTEVGAHSTEYNNNRAGTDGDLRAGDGILLADLVTASEPSPSMVGFEVEIHGGRFRRHISITQSTGRLPDPSFDRRRPYLQRLFVRYAANGGETVPVWHRAAKTYWGKP